MNAGPEISEFLASHRRAFLVTVTARGAPVVHPMSLIMDGGAMYFYTYRKSAKVRNLERDPRVSCLVATPDEVDAFAAVEVRGTAAVVDVDELSESLLDHHTPGASDVPASEQIRHARERLASGKRVYVRVTPSDSRSCGPLSAPLAQPSRGTAASRWPEVTPQLERARAMAMTAEEATTYLAHKSIAAFATIGADGAPTSVPARYVARGGSVLFTVPADDPAVDNVRARHLACATVEEFPTYDAIKGVMLRGSASVTSAEHWGHDVAESVEGSFVALTLEVEAPVTFDFEKLRRGASA